MRSWKTTGLGILTLLGGISNAGLKLLRGESPTLEDLAMITAGIGLILAKDASK